MKRMLLVSMFQNVASLLKAVEPNLKIIAAYSDSLNLKIISDNQAILVEGNEVKILDK